MRVDKNTHYHPQQHIFTGNEDLCHESGKNIWEISKLFDEHVHWGIILLNGPPPSWYRYAVMVAKIVSKLRLLMNIWVSVHRFTVTSPCLCDTVPNVADLLSHREVGVCCAVLHCGCTVCRQWLLCCMAWVSHVMLCCGPWVVTLCCYLLNRAAVVWHGMLFSVE